MRHKSILLLATGVPTAAELAIIFVSSTIPNLLAIGGDGRSVPSPSALGIIWSVLLVYVIGMIPFLLLYYLADLGKKTALSFAVIEVAFYITFFRLIPAPSNFPIVAWWNIPVVALIILANLTRFFSHQTKILQISAR